MDEEEVDGWVAPHDRPGQTQGEYLAEKEAKKKAKREERELTDRKVEEITKRFGKQ